MDTMYKIFVETSQQFAHLPPNKGGPPPNISVDTCPVKQLCTIMRRDPELEEFLSYPARLGDGLETLEDVLDTVGTHPELHITYSTFRQYFSRGGYIGGRKSRSRSASRGKSRSKTPPPSQHRLRTIPNRNGEKQNIDPAELRRSGDFDYSTAPPDPFRKFEGVPADLIQQIEQIGVHQQELEEILQGEKIPITSDDMKNNDFDCDEKTMNKAEFEYMAVDRNPELLGSTDELDKIDTNHDGKIDEEEAAAEPIWLSPDDMKVVRSIFDSLDRDFTGSINPFLLIERLFTDKRTQTFLESVVNRDGAGVCTTFLQALKALAKNTPDDDTTWEQFRDNLEAQAENCKPDVADELITDGNLPKNTLLTREDLSLFLTNKYRINRDMLDRLHDIFTHCVGDSNGSMHRNKTTRKGDFLDQLRKTGKLIEAMYTTPMRQIPYDQPNHTWSVLLTELSKHDNAVISWDDVVELIRDQAEAQPPTVTLTSTISMRG